MIITIIFNISLFIFDYGLGLGNLHLILVDFRIVVLGVGPSDWIVSELSWIESSETNVALNKFTDGIFFENHKK